MATSPTQIPPADKPDNNPLYTVGHWFTSTLHHETYPTISPSRATNHHGANIVIIGASRGIGLAIALSYARAGAANIALCARTKNSAVVDKVKNAAHEAGFADTKVLAVEIEVTSEDGVKAAAGVIEAEFDGKVDVLVHNSGVLGMGTVEDVDVKDWWRIWEVNLLGPFLTAKYFMPALKRGGRPAGNGGQIVIVSSVGAWCATPGGSAYQGSKLAVARLVEFISKEQEVAAAAAPGGEESKDGGVIAFCVHPGNCATDMTEGVDESIAFLFIDQPSLTGDTIVFLTNEKRKWLAGRYVSVTWDMPELMSREKEIVEGGKLKVTMQV